MTLEEEISEEAESISIKEHLANTIKREYLGTIHSIEVDGEEPIEFVKVGVDKMLLLYNSKLRSELDGVLDNFMDEYWELPFEEMYRVLPETVKYNIEKVKEKMSKSARNYTIFHNAKKPMLINDENDVAKTVLPIELLRDDIPDKEEQKLSLHKQGVHYNSIQEIMKDANLDYKEKIRMCEEYMKAKYSEDEKPLYTDDGKRYTKEAGSLDIYEIIPEKVKKPKRRTIKEVFLSLCEKYPHKFSMEKKSGRIQWETISKGAKYQPSIITLSIEKSKAHEKELLNDSTVRYIHYEYKVGKRPMYITRINRD